MTKKRIRIIISPAKKMEVRNDILPNVGMPPFLEKTEELLNYMKSLDYGQLKEVWKCNDKIAAQNYERVRRMDLRSNLTPAILAYEGIQYKYMGPAVFQRDAYEYLEEHLYILSGFYGALKPFDGVTPYRLEMQARFGQDFLDRLYDFWGSGIAELVLSDCAVLVNLASREYSKCITGYLPADIPCVTCVFGEWVNGKVKEKGTYAKMARGEMVRFMAEERIEQAEGIKAFNRLGYHFEEELSDAEKYIFIK